jgi:hypothetical protein
MAVIVRGTGRYELLHGASSTANASPAVVDGSQLDARAWRSIDYSLFVYSSSAVWTIWGSNASDYGSEVQLVASAAVASGATGTFSQANAPYQYYRVKVVRSASADAECSLYGLMTG